VAKTKKAKAKKGDTPIEEGAEAPAKSKGGLIGAILTPVLLAAASFGTVFSLPSPKAAHVEVSTDTHHSEPEAVSFEPEEQGIVVLNEFVISIRSDRQVLRILLALETPKDNVENIDPNDLRLRDAFMSYLRAVDVEQLADVSFLPQLRAQLLRRAKLVLGEDNATGILVTDFLIR